MQIKKIIRRSIISLSNKIFGRELTHRSEFVRRVNTWRVQMIHLLSPSHRRQARFERLNPEAPWFVPLSLPFIDKLLSPFFTGFEWGSGRSTIWFAKRIHRIISIEGRLEWYEQIRRRVHHEGLDDKIDLHLVEITSEYNFEATEIERYAGAIDCIPQYYLDFVVIDGHFRVACLERCLDKVRPGGFIILDNSDLPEFENFFQLFCEAKYHTFGNGIWETTIFEVPPSGLQKFRKYS